MEREEQIHTIYEMFLAIRESVVSEKYNFFPKEKKVEGHGERGQK